MEVYRSDIDGIRQLLPAPTAPTQTVAKQKGRVVELTHEDTVDEVDELAGDVGKLWNLPTPLGMYRMLTITYGPRKGWQWALRQRYYSVSS